MPITVELQDMHSYSIITIVVAVTLLVLLLAATIVIIVKIIKKDSVKSKAIEITPENRENIKQKYYRQLYNLEQNCHGGKLSNRKAYQELSKIARHFVYEATGIKVHNYTLEEIKQTNISGLYSVISECYMPEFAIDKDGDIYGSINKTRKVIEEWN
ncbi:MAG: hypothetical protein IJP13_07780 [Lachnospiraceae bacterium]|nr:hypothetical protein [Lachnospiraceae bacterium]